MEVRCKDPLLRLVDTGCRSYMHLPSASDRPGLLLCFLPPPCDGPWQQKSWDRASGAWACRSWSWCLLYGTACIPKRHIKNNGCGEALTAYITRQPFPNTPQYFWAELNLLGFFVCLLWFLFEQFSRTGLLHPVEPSSAHKALATQKWEQAAVWRTSLKAYEVEHSYCLLST